MLKNKRPRGLTVQPEVVLNGDNVEYRKFENNSLGHISSGVAHFGEASHEVIEEWEKNNQEFRY